jgi:hypothetical protein
MPNSEDRGSKETQQLEQLLRNGISGKSHVAGLPPFLTVQSLVLPLVPSALRSLPRRLRYARPSHCFSSSSGVDSVICLLALPVPPAAQSHSSRVCLPPHWQSSVSTLARDDRCHRTANITVACSCGSWWASTALTPTL